MWFAWRGSKLLLCLCSVGLSWRQLVVVIGRRGVSGLPYQITIRRRRQPSAVSRCLVCSAQESIVACFAASECCLFCGA